MSKTWKKGGGTYDTDKYKYTYHVDENKLYKSVWPETPFVGPGTYNKSHIDLIIENYNNDVNHILDPTNPFFSARATLSSERVKFTP